MALNLLRRKQSEPSAEAEAPRPAGAVAPAIELIVGLGNPGATYAGNRHNVGYWTVNRLARRLGIEVDRHTKVASVGEGQFAANGSGRRLVLAKPRTYMNESGHAIRELLRRYRLGPRQMLLVYDDLDLPCARVRVRERGGSGGQKGMKSIVDAAGTQDFPRIRIGIGRPLFNGEPSWDPEVISRWVLGNPPPEQRSQLERAADRAADAAICCLENGVVEAMNRFNRD